METTSNPTPLPYHERPLSPRERKLLKRLWEQHEEGVLWSRFFVRLLPFFALCALEVTLVGLFLGWQSTALMLVIGVLFGMLLMSFTYNRIARRNWPIFMRIINWHDVEQLRIRDAEAREQVKL